MPPFSSTLQFFPTIHFSTSSPSFPLSACTPLTHLIRLTCTPAPVLFAAHRVEGRVSEQTAWSPSAHPQSSAVSRPLPEAIRSSHKHTCIHSLHFYLLVTLSSLLLISFPLLSFLFPCSLHSIFFFLGHAVFMVWAADAVSMNTHRRRTSIDTKTPMHS